MAVFPGFLSGEGNSGPTRCGGLPCRDTAGTAMRETLSLSCPHVARRHLGSQAAYCATQSYWGPSSISQALMEKGNQPGPYS